MKLLKSMLALVAVISFATLPAYGAATTEVEAPATPAVETSDRPVQPDRIELDPLFLSASGDDLAGYLIRSSGGGLALCEEYTIDCIEEEDDTCCADYEACLGYCERVCNGPCGPAAQ